MNFIKKLKIKSNISYKFYIYNYYFFNLFDYHLNFIK